MRLPRWMVIIGPGILVAATGVGAGDLATAGFTGAKLGVAVAWVVLLGAFLKFVLNEGLARYQLATGQTLLEGATLRLGRPVQYIFAAYLLAWSYFVGSALISACGVAGHALLPIFDDPVHGKQVFGIAHSLLALGMVWVGGFRWFSRIMSVCIAVMFVTVLATAAALKPDLAALGRGLTVPVIPATEGSVGWTVALMGGVGGTLTVLCYGYWIREAGRENETYIRTCRIDLLVAYTFTALFGVAMLVVGQAVQLEGKGAGLIVQIGDVLRQRLGDTARWAFLIGAWGALFSSLLGVLQSVPYVFADFAALVRHGDARPAEVNTRSPAYRGYLIAMAIIPLYALFSSFERVQMVYSVFGAFFMPLLAIALLLLNGRRKWVGEHVNRPITVVILIATTIFFSFLGANEVSKTIDKWRNPPPPTTPAPPVLPVPPAPPAPPVPLDPPPIPDPTPIP